LKFTILTQKKSLNDMLTAPTATQNTLSNVKDGFTEVITQGMLSFANKPSNWNVVITEKALLDTMRTSSPPPKEI
jgi:hypothetical protein